jgi:hypothetical protein
MRHVLLSDCTSYQTEDDGLVPNKLAAPNAAMTSLFQCGYHWRGIGEPERWAASPHDTV